MPPRYRRSFRRAMSMSMSANAVHVAHHFDDAEQQYMAAELGTWVFLATEVLFFGGLFASYTIYRYWYPQAFIEGSHHLDLWLGSINTAILLTSSLTMAMSVHAAQTNQPRDTVRNLALTVLLGSAFLGIKGYEYYHKYEEHLVPGHNFRMPDSKSAHADAGESRSSPPPELQRQAGGPNQLFFSLYFAMTGLHALHMIIGVGILLVLIVTAWRGAFSAEWFTPVEMTGLYWHFVDIVWVFLFPLLYLVR
jgi:cytochrome c oxidase subunit 3